MFLSVLWGNLLESEHDTVFTTKPFIDYEVEENGFQEDEGEGEGEGDGEGEDEGEGEREGLCSSNQEAHQGKGCG